ncbi:transmembrane protein, putative [Bodo saltans]|uniref:Transmembrane protein, putative n=1 Tax=Bodo saltans TaxID=75058 RepID=A0A0S4JAY6_BODSA|nr:transmembrane protein, putative [Bodo saltans]|eukprot:CUG87365.1 transmembrane protein, putative [Bodo saltans]
MDASLAPVGPGKSGRVGLWSHGVSFEEDAAFFEEEDKIYAEWFEQHQIEQQRKKLEELRVRREAKRSASSSSSKTTDVNTAAAIKLRSTNRRRVLNSKSNLLHMKFKALQVDVRGAFKRFNRALGVANRTLSETEAQYAREDLPKESGRRDMLVRVLMERMRHLGSLGQTTTTTKTEAKWKKNTTTRTSSGNGSSTSVAAPWMSMGRSVGASVYGAFDSAMVGLHLRGSLPYPVLLEHEDMAIFELERVDLLEDARDLDAQLARAEAGLHEAETKLRTTQLEKQEAETDEDEDEDEDTPKKKVKKETSAQAEARVETKRRQKERKTKYTEMRSQMANDVLAKIQSMKKTVDHHRSHYIGLIRSAAAVVPDELLALRKQKSENQRTMTGNDESTVQLRQEMKAMSKLQKKIQTSIAELEAIDKASNAITRMTGYTSATSSRASATSALTLDVALSALRLNLRARQGQVQDQEAAAAQTPSPSIVMQIFGLTNAELQDYLAIPLLASVIIAWTLQTVCKYCAKGTLFSLRQLEHSVQRLRSILTPKSPNEVARFSWKLFALTSLQGVLRLLIVFVLFLGRTLIPLLVPFLCVVQFEGRVVRRDEFFGVSSAHSLFFRSSHLLATHQRVAVFLLITLTSGVVYLAAERVGSPQNGGKYAKTTGGRRLGRN